MPQNPWKYSVKWTAFVNAHHTPNLIVLLLFHRPESKSPKQDVIRHSSLPALTVGHYSPQPFTLPLSLPLTTNIPTMLSRSALRAATRNSRNPGATRAVGFAAAGKAQAPISCSSSSSTLPIGGRRYISMYGYTQAKALVYSKYGEPKDVLRSVVKQPFRPLSPFCGCEALCYPEEN